MSRRAPVIRDAWTALRAHTAARIALGRSGSSLPTEPLLEFQHAHARARDAVHAPFDADRIDQALRERGFQSIRVHSRATDRAIYLQRPDLGRRLDASSQERLASKDGAFADAAFVIADGLSTLAAERHAVAVLALAHRTLLEWGWRSAPIVIAEQSRVALADEIGALLGAGQVAILIGERPGLSAADSLGIYLTYRPRVGRTDAERNCISNIRPGGLGYAEAAHKLVYLMREAARRSLTGVDLKDDSASVPMLVSE